eukprot:TRINITY_DN20446_c0_g1_i1.p1 TRINITY_DN20446_c0_g1~~TRINITY_DN20446_c0_g1_i1.p1  ORF type:complete len:236 (-),score=28.61 TRINITY_DN20446_c0_g1_i1:326-1033(-)
MGAAPSCLIENEAPLWQGGDDVLSDPSGAFFTQNSIKDVVSICETIPDPSLGLNVLHIDEPDNAAGNIRQHFRRALLFINSARTQGRPVFIHCAAGLSRSSTVSVAYLMAHLGHSLEEALSFVGKRRENASPNIGFFAQLESFQRHDLKAIQSEMESPEQKQLAAADKLYISKLPKEPVSIVETPVLPTFTIPSHILQRQKMNPPPPSTSSPPSSAKPSPSPSPQLPPSPSSSAK